ncbi:MAG TPA: cation:proton antiporter [Candidatus Paceibacterota bacterium]
MASEIAQLAVVLSVASVLGYLARLFRQPLILAYLATGLLLNYFYPAGVHDSMRIFADLGIMFLLFLVGLEINYESFRIISKPALIIGLAQVLITFGAGFWIAKLLHFGIVSAFYIGVALTFSSTIIAVKVLTEKKDMHSLYGRIAVGILLIQDLVAIILLVILSGVRGGQGVEYLSILGVVGKAIVLFGLMLYLGRKILPFVLDKVARSHELLFVMSLAWVFLVAAFAELIGFSIEIAGFLAGLALANSAEHFQISARVRPLRDFFILIFFVALGSSITFSNIGESAISILILSLFVLIGNPLIVLVVMGLMGYRKRTGFMTGMAIAQISEFSLVLVALGAKIGHLDNGIVSLIAAVGLTTFILSSYLLQHSEFLFQFFARALSLFERRHAKDAHLMNQEFHKPIILIGAHRTGQSILDNLDPKDVLVIDFNPEILPQLQRRKIDYLFGDLADQEIFEKANFDEAKLVISTSPDFEDNLMLISQLKDMLERPKLIVRAETEKDAELLYSHGADYVLLPHFTAGQYLGKTIAVDPDMSILRSLKERDLKLLHKQHIGLED